MYTHKKLIKNPACEFLNVMQPVPHNITDKKSFNAKLRIKKIEKILAGPNPLRGERNMQNFLNFQLYIERFLIELQRIYTLYVFMYMILILSICFSQVLQMSCLFIKVTFQDTVFRAKSISSPKQLCREPITVQEIHQYTTSQSQCWKSITCRTILFARTAVVISIIIKMSDKHFHPSIPAPH